MTFVKSTALSGLFLGCGLIGTGAMAADTPDDHTYHVTVYSSFGTQFDDCFTFRPGTPRGRLTITRYGQSEFYNRDGLNSEPPAWQATSPSTNAFALSFHGTTAGFDAQVINANGINE